MTNVIVHGDKFALIALESRSAVDLPPTELTPGLWASSESMIGLDEFWREVLGTIQVEHFRSCSSFCWSRNTQTIPQLMLWIRHYETKCTDFTLECC